MNFITIQNAIVAFIEWIVNPEKGAFLLKMFTGAILLAVGVCYSPAGTAVLLVGFTFLFTIIQTVTRDRIL